MDCSKVKPLPNYAGVYDPETSSTNSALIGMATQNGIQSGRLFTMKYQVLPCTMTSSVHYHRGTLGQSFASLHAISVLEHLVDEYKLDAKTFLSHAIFDFEKKYTCYSEVYIDLGDYLTIHLTDGHVSLAEMDNPFDLKPDIDDKKFFCFNNVSAFYIPQTIDRARHVISQLSDFKLFPIIETCLQMVCYNPQAGFYISNISIKRPLIKDLRLNYGDGFVEGTGKTYYIRYLINEIKDKNLIYVPPDLVPEMTKPGFMPFLMQHHNSILIIEDAENIILDRKENHNTNQAVSNLLNLSDGLLDDAMHQQIITTFNCEMKGIDLALLREGRLIVEHKFDKWSVESNIDGAGQVQEPMSLAEIYAKN